MHRTKAKIEKFGKLVKKAVDIIIESIIIAG